MLHFVEHCIFLHANARHHTAITVQEILEHPPYLPNTILLGNVKEALYWIHYNNRDDIFHVTS